MNGQRGVSAEVLALRRHYSDLVGSIQDPEDISGLLYSQSMISRSVRDEVQERGHLIAQRKNEVLINAVEACVKASPQTFYVFTDVLRRVPYMTRCVGALTATVEQERSKQLGAVTVPTSQNVDVIDGPDWGNGKIPNHNVDVLRKRRNLTSADAEKHFQAIYDTLQESLNPDDIIAKLYSARILSAFDRDDVNNLMYTTHQRTTKLLAAVERAISADPKNFLKFLDVLETSVNYKPIVLRARESLIQAQEQARTVSCLMDTTVPTSPKGTRFSHWTIAGLAIVFIFCLSGCYFLSFSDLNLKEGSSLIAHSDQDQKSSFHQAPRPATVETCRLELNTKNLMNEVFAENPAMWKSIGIQLGLLDNELTDIELQTAGMPDRNMEASSLVLAKWKALGRSPYSWSVMIEALESPAVRAYDIAAELRTKCGKS